MENQGISQQVREAQEKFLVQQNKLNLLLVKEYKLRKQQAEFQAELTTVQNLIAKTKNKSSKDASLSRSIIAQDKYLRETIRNNSAVIRDLERKVEIHDLVEKCEKLAEVHENFRKVLSFDYEKNKVRETVGALRTRIDQLKKKSKDTVKEIQTLQQAQKSQIDQLSHQAEILREEEAKVQALREQIRLKKEQAKS